MSDAVPAIAPLIPDRSALVELAAEVVISYMARNAVPPAEIPALIATSAWRAR